MKYKQRKDKIHKTHTLAGRNEANLKNRVTPISPNPTTQAFNYIRALYEGEWETSTPIFPTWEWLLESFNSMNDNPSNREQGSCDTCGGYDIIDAVTFDETWKLYLNMVGTQPIGNGADLTWDFGYQILNGGEPWNKTYYRCVNADWEGWSDDLVDGKCPTDGANVVASTSKYLDADGEFNCDLTDWKTANPDSDRWMASYSSIQMTHDFGLLLPRVKMHWQIDDMNFSAITDYAGSFIDGQGCVGGAVYIIFEIETKAIPGTVDKVMVYEYTNWSVDNDTSPAESYWFDPGTWDFSTAPRIVLTSLENIDRNLFDDYKTLYGEISEATWLTYRIHKLNIIAKAHATVHTTGSATPFVSGSYEFDIDNIRVLGTDETLIKFPYTLESSQLELGDGMLPFIHTTVLTKITDSVNIDEFLPISPHYTPFQRLELLRKVASSKEETINYYILEKQGSIVIDLEYPWTDFEYPQFKLKVDYIPDQVAIENIKEELT